MKNTENITNDDFHFETVELMLVEHDSIFTCAKYSPLQYD